MWGWPPRISWRQKQQCTAVLAVPSTLAPSYSTYNLELVSTSCWDVLVLFKEEVHSQDLEASCLRTGPFLIQQRFAWSCSILPTEFANIARPLRSSAKEWKLKELSYLSPFSRA